MAENKSKREDKDFVKMYRKFIKEISDLSFENPTALKILLFLIRNMDGSNALAITTESISQMVSLSRQTVSKQVKYLAEHGWLEIFKLGTTNVYVVNPDVAWTSYAEQKKYCKFQGSLLLSGDDNWEVKQREKNFYKYVDIDTCKQIDEKEDSGSGVVSVDDELEGQIHIDDIQRVV